MNKQEMFNKVWAGLENQGWQRSVHHPNGGCRYRGSNELKCAAGHLIPDENYNLLLEGKRIYSLLEKNPDLFGFPLSAEEIEFVVEMQTAHDSFEVKAPLHPIKTHETYPNLKAAFEALAKEHDLRIGVDVE
jgi:hypothetical protein